MHKIKIILTTVSLIICFDNVYSQNKLSKFQLVGSYNNALTTAYSKSSGEINLVGRTGVSVVSLQAAWQFKEQKKWFARFGVEGKLFIQNEIFSGLSGKFPDSFLTNNGYVIPLRRHRRNARGGANYIERIGLSFQLAGGYNIYKKNNHSLSFITTFSPTIYIGAENEQIRQYGISERSATDYKYYIVFNTERDFYTDKVINISNSLMFTRPIVEFQFAIEGNYLLKKGALVYGIKANINAEKFEEAKYTILPEFPAYTSTGSYTLNRSYVGIYAGYRFKKK